MRKILFICLVTVGMSILGVILNFLSPHNIGVQRANSLALSDSIVQMLIITFMIVSAVFVVFYKRIWIE